jgi:hypothetical protein
MHNTTQTHVLPFAILVARLTTSRSLIVVHWTTCQSASDLNLVGRDMPTILEHVVVKIFPSTFMPLCSCDSD